MRSWFAERFERQQVISSRIETAGVTFGVDPMLGVPAGTGIHVAWD
jgi:hypothetical protein